MMARSALVLDVSRLVSRAGRAAPTGIDRVELGEALRALEGGREVFFHATRGRRTWFLDREEVRALSSFLRARWSAGSAEGWAAAGRLAHFLGCELARTPPSVMPEPTRPARAGSLQAWLRTAKTERLLRDPGCRVVYRNVSHHHLDKPGFLENLRQRWGARIEIFWHDAIPILWPEYSRPGDAEKHERRLDAMLACADRIMVNSMATRDELERLAAGRRRALPPVEVQPLRPGLPPASGASSFRGGRPYFVTVGTIEPRKNHRLLLEIWRELARERGDRCPALVLAGRRGWMNSDTFALLDRSPVLKGHVVEAPELPDAILADLIADARALLMPSFAEGFGLPVVEAQMLGTPVIASDLEVFGEVATAPYHAIGCLDGEGWKACILDLADTAHDGTDPAPESRTGRETRGALP